MKSWDIRLIGLNQNMTQAKNHVAADPKVYLKLSERPDGPWIRIFEQELANQPRPIDKWSGSARVEGPNVVFTCPLAGEKIQGWIDMLKPAIQRTNQARARLALEEEKTKAGDDRGDSPAARLREVADKLRF
jgi:hypothetical protein